MTLLDDPTSQAPAPEQVAGEPVSHETHESRLRPIDGPRALMLVVGGIYGAIGSRPLYDNSFLTHLATGREILASGFPRTNPFLYSSTDFPMPSYWWSIILASVERLGGGIGLRLFTAALSALLGVLIVRLALFIPPREGAEDNADTERRTLLAVLVPMILATVCLMPFINSRPQLPGFVLLALVVLIWNERRSPIWLVPIFAFWVNVHGTWLYGIAIVGLFLVTEAIGRLRFDAERLKMLGAAVAGLLIGGAMYPERFALLLLPTRQFGSELERDALRLYIEWRPVETGDPLFWLLIGLGLIALYGALTGGRRDRARGVPQALAAIGLVLLGMSGYRLVPIAAIALVPLVSGSLGSLGTLSLPSGRTARVLGVVGVVLLSGSALNTFRGSAYDLEMYPVKMVDQLADKGLIGGHVRSLTRDFAGNYLEWRLGADANTYVDDRPGATTFLNYADIFKLGDSPSERQRAADALRAADPDIIIWDRKNQLDQRLRKQPEWFLAKSIDGWDLFCAPRMVERCKQL